MIVTRFGFVTESVRHCQRCLCVLSTKHSSCLLLNVTSGSVATRLAAYNLLSDAAVGTAQCASLALMCSVVPSARRTTGSWNCLTLRQATLRYIFGATSQRGRATFLTSTLGVGWSASCSGCFNHMNKRRCPLNERVSWPHNWSRPLQKRPHPRSSIPYSSPRADYVNRRQTYARKSCVISGFRRGVNETFALLRCYAATFLDNLSVPSSWVKQSTSKTFWTVYTEGLSRGAECGVLSPQRSTCDATPHAVSRQHSRPRHACYEVALREARLRSAVLSVAPDISKHVSVSIFMVQQYKKNSSSALDFRRSFECLLVAATWKTPCSCVTDVLMQGRQPLSFATHIDFSSP
jgi:hypothetical protein